METIKKIDALCARCGTEIKNADVGFKFFLPTPKTNGNIKSCEVCPDCFKAHVEGPPNKLVELRIDRAPLIEWICLRCGARQTAAREPEFCVPIDQGGCDRRGCMNEKGKAPKRW
jgi:hypothetical protein